MKIYELENIAYALDKLADMVDYNKIPCDIDNLINKVEEYIEAQKKEIEELKSWTRIDAMDIDELEDCKEAFDRIADIVGCKYRKVNAIFLASEVEDLLYKKDNEIEVLQQEIEELKAQLETNK